MPDLKCDWRREGVYPLNSKVRKGVLSKTTSYCDCCRLDSEPEAFQFAGAEKKKDDIVAGYLLQSAFSASSHFRLARCRED